MMLREKHRNNSISSDWKIAFFRRGTGRAGTVGASETFRAHFNLRFLVGLAIFLLHRPDTPVSLPGVAVSSLHSSVHGVGIRIGRTNTPAGYLDAFNCDLGCDPVVKRLWHRRRSAKRRDFLRRDIRVISFGKAV